MILKLKSPVGQWMMSLNKQEISDIEKTKDIVGSLLSSKIVLCQSIKGGRNSQVYKFECANGECFIGKFYYQDKNDSRDRLGVEYSSLEFLWQKGIRCVPQPLTNDSKSCCAIYQYIDGKNFSGQDITQADIDQALEFVVDLQNIQRNIPVSQFSDASEAYFSIEKIEANIEYRRKRLEGIKHEGLQDFLKADFDIFWAELVLWVKEKSLETGVSLQETIALDKRTLSPSDFGFHNAIKKKDGKIVFCDFEYFGWDDPAKLTSDFLLHPAMRLSEVLKGHFVRGIQNIFSTHEDLRARLRVVYPLFAMKWCLILLNEFLAQDFSRRLFADQEIERERLLIQQLDKAKNMLKHLKNMYQDNLYAK